MNVPEANSWTWQSAQQTHRGKHRRHNEDAVLSRSSAGLWVVADGMGGHEAGEVASQAITGALAALPLAGSLSSRVDRVEDALLAVNDQLRAHALGQGLGATVGSTVVAMLTAAGVGVALWAGDSRLYRLRDGRLEQVTRDHNPVSDLLDSGAVTEAEALAAETNVITRAVGGQQQLFLDIAVFDVSPEDTFLLCSDGLYRDLALEEMTEVLCGPTSPWMAEQLLERALRGPALDNISLVVTRAEPR
jgi:serine/threonine protein phosphatase PrpC